MVQLQKDIATIEATGTQVVGVSYDSIDVLRKFAEPAGISFPLLSDEGSKTIRAFGIHFRDGLPHPGTYLIDRKGIASSTPTTHLDTDERNGRISASDPQSCGED